MKTRTLLTSTVLLVMTTLTGGCTSAPSTTRTFYTDVKVLGMERASACSGSGSGATVVGALVGAAIGGHIGGSTMAKVGNAVLFGAAGGYAGSKVSANRGRQRCNDHFYKVQVAYVDPQSGQPGRTTVNMENRPFSRYLENVRITVPRMTGPARN